MAYKITEEIDNNFIFKKSIEWMSLNLLDDEFENYSFKSIRNLYCYVEKGGCYEDDVYSHSHFLTKNSVFLVLADNFIIQDGVIAKATGILINISLNMRFDVGFLSSSRCR